MDKEISNAQALSEKDLLKKMKRVLRRLGHIDGENVIQLKGRIACEVSTADELVITELIFNGVFNELDPAQTAALLSALIFTEKGDDAGKVRDELDRPLRQLREAARRVAEIYEESKITIDVEEFVAKFRPDLMDVVYAWCHGSKFADICKMTQVFEGSVIRAIRRLEELIRQLASAAKAIGDTDLEAKFLSAAQMIKRDIIFAASLYL